MIIRNPPIIYIERCKRLTTWKFCNLDTQRKLSELQAEFRAKEAEHENEIQSMQTDYKQRLETEIAEKKHLGKELVRIKILPNNQ